MATVTAGSFSIDFDQLDVTSFLLGAITVSSSGQFSTTDSGITDSFFGNFTYANGRLTGGVMIRLQEVYQGQIVFDITGVNLPVTTFLQWALTGDDAAARAYILGGADSLAGSNLGDVIRGLTGADSIAGGDGNDTLDGGDGADVINGNLGNDVILGGSGLNYLRGDEGDDSIVGGADFDDIHGNMGNDTESGGDGDDWVVGGKDNDLLFGDNGNDIVYGNLGNDTCIGGDGGDLIRGGQADDSLSGGNGNDWLSGDRGNDTISGGAGADVFHSFSGAGIDRVIDFSISQGDRVQLDQGTVYAVSQVGGDTVIDMGNGDQVILVGVTASALPNGAIFLI